MEVDSESGPATGSPGEENDDPSQVTKPGKHFKIIDISLPVATVADDSKNKEKGENPCTCTYCVFPYMLISFKHPNICTCKITNKGDNPYCTRGKKSL